MSIETKIESKPEFVELVVDPNYEISTKENLKDKGYPFIIRRKGKDKPVKVYHGPYTTLSLSNHTYNYHVVLRKQGLIKIDPSCLSADPEDLEIDHKDGHTDNNSSENLRLVTKSLNIKNKIKPLYNEEKGLKWFRILRYGDSSFKRRKYYIDLYEKKIWKRLTDGRFRLVKKSGCVDDNNKLKWIISTAKIILRVAHKYHPTFDEWYLLNPISTISDKD